MLCSTHRRVQVCPVKALAAVSAEARAWLPERFRSQLLGGGAPFALGAEAQTCARPRGKAAEVSARRGRRGNREAAEETAPDYRNPPRDDAPQPEGGSSLCPPEAVARLEAWLLSTRGAELRKAKCLDTALRSMAHVTCVWSLDATQPTVAYDLTRRPEKPETHLRQLRLPDAEFAGHIIGRDGKFIKALLKRWPQLRVQIHGDTVSVIGPLADVEFVADRLQGKVQAETERPVGAREQARLREIEEGTPATGKVTWTGLPKLSESPEPAWWVRIPSCSLSRFDYARGVDGWWEKDLDDLDRKRDYRERQRQRVGRGQTVRAQQHEDTKRMKTRTRIGCKGRVLHLRPRRGGTNARTRGATLDLRELLADLFC